MSTGNGLATKYANESGHVVELRFGEGAPIRLAPGDSVTMNFEREAQDADYREYVDRVCAEAGLTKE